MCIGRIGVPDFNTHHVKITKASVVTATLISFPSLLYLCPPPDGGQQPIYLPWKATSWLDPTVINKLLSFNNKCFSSYTRCCLEKCSVLLFALPDNKIKTDSEDPVPVSNSNVFAISHRFRVIRWFAPKIRRNDQLSTSLVKGTSTDGNTCIWQPTGSNYVLMSYKRRRKSVEKQKLTEYGG